MELFQKLASISLRTIGAVVDRGSTAFCAGGSMGSMKLGDSRMVIHKLDVKLDNFTEMWVFCFVLLL